MRFCILVFIFPMLSVNADFRYVSESTINTYTDSSENIDSFQTFPSQGTVHNTYPSGFEDCPVGRKADSDCYCGERTHHLRNISDSYSTILDTKKTYITCNQGQQCIPAVYARSENLRVFGKDNYVRQYSEDGQDSSSALYRNPACLRANKITVGACPNALGIKRNLRLCKCNNVYIRDAFCNARLNLASDEPVATCEFRKGKQPNPIFGEFCACGRLESRCEYLDYCHEKFQKCSKTPISSLSLGQCSIGQKTNSQHKVCKCSAEEYCDGQDYCLIDGTCSVIAQPECTNTNGQVPYSGSYESPVCICGTGDNMKKVGDGEYCDTNMPKNYDSSGSTFPTCTNTSPFKRLENWCTCGTDTSGEYAEYNDCKYDQFCNTDGKCSNLLDCPNKDGTIQLNLQGGLHDTNCKCQETDGTDNFWISGTKHHGKYCNAEIGMVDTFPIPTCQRHDDVQPERCACASKAICLQNQYCNFELGRCDDVPNQQCSHVLGQIRNDNTCACGKAICNAPGQFCDCGIDSPECNNNEHATCSSYQQCSNTVGDVENEKACQCGTAQCGPAQFCNRDKNLCSATPNAMCEPSLDLLETSCYCNPQGDMCPQGKVCHPSDGCIATAAECDGRQACNCEGTICKAGDFCDQTDKVCTPYNTSSELTYLSVKERTCEDQNHYSVYGKTECKIAAQQYKNLADVVVLQKESGVLTQPGYVSNGAWIPAKHWDVRYPKGCTWLPDENYANSHSPNSDMPCSSRLECLCALPICKAEDLDIVNYKCACHGETCTSESGLYCYTLDSNVDAKCQQYPQCTRGQQASQTCMCSEGHECQAGEYCKTNGLCDTQIPCARNKQIIWHLCVCGNHECSSGEFCIGNVCSPTATLPTATCGNQTTTDCICANRVCPSGQTCRNNNCVEILNFDSQEWAPLGVGQGSDYCVSHRYTLTDQSCANNQVISNTCNCGNYTGAPNELCKDNKIYSAII